MRYHGKLIDCQVLNAHTASLGAVDISRAAYLEQLDELANQPVDPACWQSQRLF
jgi:leucyl/phenylalanyl-tRNA--protein transferase